MFYTWRATYKDGTVFDKSKDDALSVDRLDRKQLKQFELVNQTGKSLMTLHLDPGQRLIYRMRGDLDRGTGKDLVCHLLGWQQTVGGQNVQSILYVFEDGRIEMAGRFREDHPWFYAPKLRRVEVED
jgi:hypothetical protein